MSMLSSLSYTLNLCTLFALHCYVEDGEFELTAEMLIHDDVDDEQTLIEAEALENVGEAEEEIADLQQVQVVFQMMRAHIHPQDNHTCIYMCR